MEETKPTYSFEFFPPRTTAGKEKLAACAHELSALAPKFCSVTFGAGGSTQNTTLDTVLALQQCTDVSIAPHISCIDSSKERIRELIDNYQQAEVNRLVVLRGDLPSGMLSPGEFRYANELISYIREITGDQFHIEVACYPEFHPQSKNARADLENFKRKIDAGANSAITQYFYNPDAYFHFIDNCQQMNIDIPVVPGIMPITNHTQLARFSDNCGAEIPRWIRKRLAILDDTQQSIIDFGVEVVTELCAKLLEQNAPGLHFYTLNKAESSVKIWHNLGLNA